MAGPLTLREKDVLALLAKGSSVREIGDAFDLAERSVRAHVQMIAEKLGVRDGAEAVAAAIRDGIISSFGTE